MGLGIHVDVCAAMVHLREKVADMMGAFGTARMRR